MHGKSRRRLRFESLEPRLVLDSQLLITELVAANEQGLRDVFRAIADDRPLKLVK